MEPGPGWAVCGLIDPAKVLRQTHKEQVFGRVIVDAQAYAEVPNQMTFRVIGHPEGRKVLRGSRVIEVDSRHFHTATPGIVHRKGYR